MRLAKNLNQRLLESELIDRWNTNITTAELVRIIDKVIRPFGAKALIKWEKIKSKKKLRISGWFDEKRRGMKMVVLYHMHHLRKTILLTTKTINKIIWLTSQTVQHELNHLYQYQRQKEQFYTKVVKIYYSEKIQKKREEDIVYCCMRDELDCCARDIAMEIKYNYPYVSPRKILNTIDTRRLHTFRFYQRTFKGMDWAPVRKVLLKKVWKWLPKVVEVPKFAP